MEDETLYVEPTHLLACEETPDARATSRSATARRALEILALEGRGMVALSVASKPAARWRSRPDLPVSVPVASVITWSGDAHAARGRGPRSSTR